MPDVTLQVDLSPEDLRGLDKRRGDIERAVYVRRLIRHDAGVKGFTFGRPGVPSNHHRRRILTMIEAAGPEGLCHRDITRHTQSIDSAARNGLLQSMIDDGEIERSRLGKRGWKYAIRSPQTNDRTPGATGCASE